MSDSTKYMLVSLPSSISPTNDREEALTALRSTVTTNNGVVAPFKIPEFKIGTLDALVQQADDLSKLESACQGVVAKVGESLKSLLEGDEAKIAQQKTVNDIVPLNSKKEFLKSYETVSPMVVPRSSVEVAQDDEYILYTVTTFKKFSTEFQHKCREMKWTPRDYKYVEGGKEEERKEVERVSREERKVWGEALRLGRTGWSEAVMIWIHVLTLRVFVETVLRYGLPLDYVCGLVKTTPKLAKKAKDALDSTYSYLGGNAFGRDKKGRVTKDDSALSSEIAAAGVGPSGEGAEYSAYVYYEFEIL
ncbi:putative V-type proton ATPase subunit C [Glarea lozoyensis 74030]|uniref:V-type proton ATPase subunit C n=1 Tax=Glarea lozoyensis (strain ATCC 74030 / MF5533) TaxID=1104152 RepID=H0EKP6_GLAL7|nr:putative V-type proton ATPase subunit C [Glarea lozoyensis 74030]